MNTFKLIGMALLALCVNFTSCSSDDEEELIKNDDGIITNQKRLMRIETVYDSSEIITLEFTYDSKGRLSSANRVEMDYEDKSWCITNYTWGNTVIMSERNYGSNYDSSGKDYGKDTYFLQDNLIKNTQNWRKYDNYVSVLSYNSSKQLTNIQSKYSGESLYTNAYTWENDRIVKLVNTEKRYNDEDVYEYTYSGRTCKGYFPLYSTYDSDELFYAHPELIGMRTNQLPEQMFNKDIDKSEYYDEYYKETYKRESTDEETTKFDYTLNKDGYLESCTVTYTSVETIKESFRDKNGDGIITDDERNVTETHTYTDTTIYTFTWE